MAARNKKLTTDEFIVKAIAIFGNEYDYSEVVYKDSATKIKIKCKTHGPFQKEPNTHLSQKQGCPPCALIERSLKRTLTLDQFKTNANKIHNFKYNYDKVVYKNSNIKVIITCLVHGDFEQIPNSHLQGIGCKPCGIEKTSNIKRLTLQDFINRANQVHNFKYTYERSIYIDGHTKIIITCSEHGDFEQNPDSHVNAEHGCFKCAGIGLTTEDFINRAIKIHGYKYNYLLSEYIDSSTKIKIICPIHDVFEQSPIDHTHDKNGCPECAHNFKLTTKTFIEKAIHVHEEKYIYDKVNYIGCNEKVVLTCKIHGDFSQRAADHLQEYGCPACGGALKLTTNEFIKLASEKHNSKYTYEKAVYNNNHSHVIITCPEHGDFLQIARNHLRGVRCAKCAIADNSSKQEIEWLNAKGIHEKYHTPGIILINQQDQQVQSKDISQLEDK